MFRRAVEDARRDGIDGRPNRHKCFVRERLGRGLGAALAQSGDLLDDDHTGLRRPAAR
ncbi:hypothetical protein HLASA_3070 (plasmid) [Halanaeroarchaeum sulfurireducens]|uniref:Uncharacterized protein n=1 Tax=Halanaeroarchaeum sulfurireducens TaxID=1604004 RepID=A0A0N9N5W4_9EURY|nr:hypothetical protein HLASA_3070 [Halanaeroarchaeum sulfurireducens]